MLKLNKIQKIEYLELPLGMLKFEIANIDIIISKFTVY